jgi:hypothetical protein
MEKIVEHNDFTKNKIKVTLKGFLLSPELSYEGEMKTLKKMQYELIDDNGNTRAVKVKYNPFDVSTTLVIDGEKVRLMDPFKPHEYVWTCLPLLLIAFGGAIGGAIGAIAAIINGKFYRTIEPKRNKYIYTLAVTGGAMVSYFILAGLIHLIF